MRKLFLTVFVLLAMAVQVQAKDITAYKPLNDAAGTALSAYALTSGAAVYSETIDVTTNTLYGSLLVTENKAGGAGDVDISIEYSVDGTNFYGAYTSDMAGTLSAVGNIATALGNQTRWIVFTPRIARFIRFKFDPDADSQITVTYVYQYGN